MAMKASMVIVVGLLVVTFAFWNGEAEAQRGGGKVPQGRSLEGGGGAGKVHLQRPTGKANHKSKAVSKEAHRKQKGSPQEKQKHTAKKGGEHEKKHTGKTAVREPASQTKAKALEKPTQVGKAAPETKPAAGVPVAPKQ
jgi:hypothetical protein